MRTSLLKAAAAAAVLAGSVGSANAFVLLNLQDLSAAVSKTCNTSAAVVNVVGGNCAAVDGFSIIGGGLGISFSGTVGGWDVFTTTFASNIPGTATAATLNASTTQLKKNSAGTGDFLIDLTGFNYLLPAGGTKSLRGSASLTSSDTSFGAGNFVQSEFYADPNNTGATATPFLACNMNLAPSANCDTAQIEWNDPGLGTFSMRDVQIVRLSQGKLVNTTLSGTVGAVPEPMTLSLVGAALLAAGVASRRRAKAA
jgi:hypothetical protein